uniref:Uncharacterized protein n=1 Tax=Arundo donax TaxID=35708 RepID=A0A0A9AFI6_ARUDO
MESDGNRGEDEAVARLGRRRAQERPKRRDPRAVEGHEIFDSLVDAKGLDPHGS